MVHMWVNTVTGCGLPREEINGPRFGPPGGPGRRPLVLVPQAGPGCLPVSSPRISVGGIHTMCETSSCNCMREREGEGAPGLSSHP